MKLKLTWNPRAAYTPTTIGKESHVAFDGFLPEEGSFPPAQISGFQSMRSSSLSFAAGGIVWRRGLCASREYFPTPASVVVLFGGGVVVQRCQASSGKVLSCGCCLGLLLIYELSSGSRHQPLTAMVVNFARPTPERTYWTDVRASSRSELVREDNLTTERSRYVYNDYVVWY
ncbi:hypothetical protein K503DRAFT_817379 [Rhizopogon vinicolor AM-OR11-026]|uniref:Uncharacterized protein n=1 Tax=Rhizopogon vinicolor AM-OR11-026 TaxID=1314800 RepID=A0A1B7N0R1_9AGAM|nr:hypothetical protein K503DRAFT_817379 [Rhizopogon vinicolor AM-OR11-026]